jgi:hypothetical protein
LLFTGLWNLAVTIFFCAAICVALKSYEGWRSPVLLYTIDVRTFNALTLGLSLCLGMNLLSSLKYYASTLRWFFLGRRYVSLEVFDLILNFNSLGKVANLMIIPSPGFRRNKWLRKFRWFKDVRDDGTRWMWLACLLWIAINISAQVLVALISLFWPIKNSNMPSLPEGHVTIANMSAWWRVPGIDESMGNETFLEAASQYGMDAQGYVEFNPNEVQTETDLSNISGTPLYMGNGSASYMFLNRDPTHRHTNYIISSRKISVVARCEQLELFDNGRVVNEDSDKDAFEDFGSMYIKARGAGQEEWGKYAIPELASGSITWTASNFEYCGPRCTNFTVLQYGDDSYVKHTSLFLCNNTVGEVSNAITAADVMARSKSDEAAIYGTDSFWRIAAGAIGWTGENWNGWTDRQSRTFRKGTKWSPARAVSKQEVENILMRFSIGAITAFDDHGISYNATRYPGETSGQLLAIEWSYMLGILSIICAMQLAALVVLVIFSNRAMIRDDSFFSMAMLLNPVVQKLDRRGLTDKRGMAMSGEEIKEHSKLRFKKIRYDYREGGVGQPNQVDLFFEGMDRKEGKKNWVDGSYS